MRRVRIRILAIAAMTVVAACKEEAAPVEPAGALAPKPLVSAAGANLSSICHKTGPTGYASIAVAQSAVPAHVAHGDGFVGGQVPNRPDMVFDANCALVLAPLGLTFTNVSAGGGHTCGVTTGGAAYCWGFNSFGNLGDGTTISPRTNPVAVQGGITFATVSAGGGHTCGLSTAGAAYCWGENDNGQLGDGTTTQRTSPVPVLGGLTFAAVIAGGAHTCGLTTGGAAYCWGSNSSGELGDGTTTPRTSPVAVLGGLPFAAVSPSALYHTCGVTLAGAAYCWGYNNGGQLGDATTTDRTTPVPVAGGLTFSAVSAGGGHTCGLATGGVVYCWGNNFSGQLGDGTATARTSPVPVTGGLTFSAVSAGGYAHTCGVASGGAAYCWGRNAEGQLGNGTTTDQASPGAVLGGLTFAAVSARAYYHACGITTGGAAYCWGRNDGGQLGDGTTTNRLTPVQVVP
ncbi:MAG TPA: hypothetical protein VKB45_12350 [Gemmatimonadales bacterium]|nr:hypothetical protein [Gemmatimonadales bacterium]